MEKRDGALSENEINDGESPLADTPAGPSSVFINSSRIQLVGLFVRRFSLTPLPIALLPTPYPFSFCHVTLSLFPSVSFAYFLFSREL